MLLAFIILMSTFSYAYAEVLAQSVPLPAPNKNNSSLISGLAERIDSLLTDSTGHDGNEYVTDRTRPVIQVITEDLVEGKNVIVVKIVDDSPLTVRFAKHVSDGNIEYVDLVKMGNNEYKTLIDAQGPKAVVSFEAVDSNGNRAVESKIFDVNPSAGWFENMFRWLRGLFRS